MIQLYRCSPQLWVGPRLPLLSRQMQSTTYSISPTFTQRHQASLRMNQVPAAQHIRGFDDIFTPAQPAPAPAQPVPFETFRCEDIAVDIAASRNDSTVTVDARIRSLLSHISNLAFHVAVPRTCTVNVAPLTTTEILPQQAAIQRLTVNSENDPAKGKTLMLRIKLVYTIGGNQKEHLFQVSHTL